MIYTDIDKGSYKIRHFSANLDDFDLKWHRDLLDRKLFVIGETDWKIQCENELPKDINNCFIKKENWHRLIKGNGDLTIKIYEM